MMIDIIYATEVESQADNTYGIWNAKPLEGHVEYIRNNADGLRHASGADLLEEIRRRVDLAIPNNGGKLIRVTPEDLEP